MGPRWFRYPRSLVTASRSSHGGISTPSRKLRASHDPMLHMGHNSPYNLAHCLLFLIVSATRSKLSSVSGIHSSRFYGVLLGDVLSSNLHMKHGPSENVMGSTELPRGCADPTVTGPRGSHEWLLVVKSQRSHEGSWIASKYLDVTNSIDRVINITFDAGFVYSASQLCNFFSETPSWETKLS